jgi:alpha-galactosidase
MAALCGTVVFALVGCGGGAGAARQAAPTALLVIGNSLTNYNPVPSLGWYGSWGMAASAADKDFVHLVASSMNLPLTVRNFSGLEVTPAASAADIPAIVAPVNSTTMVVIQLSDNVQPGILTEFALQYGKLLDAVNQAPALFCISTWGKADTYDKEIEAACLKHGGHYVFIGDIRTDPANLDSQGVQFSDPGVNMHPHDWSMARIAERIVAAARQ